MTNVPGRSGPVLPSQRDPCSDVGRAGDAPARRTRGPSVRKTEATRRRIVQAALAHFLEEGISQATMAGIAERAGVAKGTLYVYFPSKEGLLQGVLEQALHSSPIAKGQVERQPGERIEALLRRTLVPSLHSLEDSGRMGLARLLLAEAQHHPALLQLYHERFYVPWHAQMRRWLQVARDEGELQGISPEEGAWMLASPFWLGVVQAQLRFGDPHAAPGIHRPIDIARMTLLQLDAIFNTVHPRPQGTAG